jgi:starch synthase
MNILMAASEMTPFCQTGGLGDVVGSLPKALSDLGIKVSVIIPLYRKVDRKKYGLIPHGRKISFSFAGRSESFRLFKADWGKAIVFFVNKPEYFDREECYGTGDIDYPDNAERFIFFSRAVVECALRLRPAPGVIHCHDWQTGLIPVLLANLARGDKKSRKIATVFTIHNLGYQGIFPREAMNLTGLDWPLFNPEGLEFWDRINFLKGGMVFADLLTTVSRKYAEEIQTPEYGFGLEGVARRHRDKLTGILNGANYDNWNPSADPYLPFHYSSQAPGGKAACKQALQAELDLTVDLKTPLVGMVSRLAEQKGIELLLASADSLVNSGIEIAVLGLGPESVHQRLKELSARWPQRFRCAIGYDTRLSHLITAGSDFMLMPSRYEPCGLNQIYSLRYGTIPIVRATGGLEDTVTDIREDPASGNGFKFREYSPNAFAETVELAVDFYRRGGDIWKKLMANAFAADFGWSQSARYYLEVYERACRGKRPESHK